MEIAPGMIKITGVSGLTSVGNEVAIVKAGVTIYGEILTVCTEHVTALLFSECASIRIGDKVLIEQESQIEPGDHWLGQIVNYRGQVANPINATIPMRTTIRKLDSAPLPAHARREIGPRLETGWMVTNTVLPICRGQRLGLFAGSGVGKSTFLGTLAAGMDADVIVIALIGERSRELNEFVRNILPEAVRAKTVVFAATASESPSAKKRAAFCAISTAEHFRDQGQNVLFLFDSITRFAEAHRETALLAGETPALNAFPPSTVRVIGEFAERAGPGTDKSGDITAVYTVLVAGSDMEEPVADMVRGILDGHIILSREIAERGRYPAIDILRSVSRALPGAATDEENKIIRETRSMIALYEEVAPMLRANLYEPGKDPSADRAIELFASIDQFVATPCTGGVQNAFEFLNEILRSEVLPSPSDKTEKKVLAGQTAKS